MFNIDYDIHIIASLLHKTITTVIWNTNGLSHINCWFVCTYIIKAQQDMNLLSVGNNLPHYERKRIINYCSWQCSGAGRLKLIDVLSINLRNIKDNDIKELLNLLSCFKLKINLSRNLTINIICYIQVVHV